MAPQLFARERGRPHAALPEKRADNWEALHTTFTREAKEAGVAGRIRCRCLFLGDSITEAMRGTQFGESYDELIPRRKVFEAHFAPLGARAFGISGDRTQHLLWRCQNGELSFRHTPEVVCLCIGTNNIGRDGDSAEDTYLGIIAVVSEIVHRLGSKVVLPGILPRGPGANADADALTAVMPSAPGEGATYTYSPPVGNGPDNKFAQPGLFSPAIHEVNRRLKDFAADSGGSVIFVDCESAFLNPEKSAIIPGLMRDALHPTAKGMEAWFKVLMPVLKEGMSGGGGTSRSLVMSAMQPAPPQMAARL